MDSIILLNSGYVPVLFQFNLGLFIALTILTILIETACLRLFGADVLKVFSEKSNIVRKFGWLDASMFAIAINVVSALIGVLFWIVLGIGV